MKTYICKFCGQTFDAEHIFEFDGEMMCEDCYDEHTTVCSMCEERIWADENDGNDEITLCHRCYDNHYTSCEECGRLIHLDSAYYDHDSDYPYCRNCYERIFDSTIKKLWIQTRTDFLWRYQFISWCT